MAGDEDEPEGLVPDPGKNWWIWAVLGFAVLVAIYYFTRAR
jgi:hypothetical protein